MACDPSSKSQPTGGGYDCKLAQELPDLLECKCPVCSLVSRDPHLTTCCGRNACKSCLPLNDQGDVQTGDAASCPLCGGQLSAVKNRNLNNEIQALETYCSYSGCDWKGKLEDYEQHLRACGFAVIQCQYCEERIRRRALDTHEQTCVRYPLTCKACAKTMERRKYHAHTHKECPLVTVACPFSQVGCELVAQRKDLRVHFESSFEYHLTLVKGVREVIAVESQSRNNALVAAEDQKVEQGELELAKLQESIQEAELKTKALQKLIVNAEREVERLTLEQRKSRAKFEDSMVQRDAEVLLLKQSIEQLQVQMKDKCYGPPLPRYPLNSIRSRPHPPVQVQNIPPLTVTVTNFSSRMRNNEVWVSPPFYTRRNGYKMCLFVYTNGCGGFRGVWVSTYVSLLKGEYDCYLAWPYLGTVTLTVYNQARNTKHVNFPVIFNGEDGAGEQVTNGHFAERMRGEEKFINHRTLNPLFPFPEQRYLSNDCLEIQITTGR